MSPRRPAFRLPASLETSDPELLAFRLDVAELREALQKSPDELRPELRRELRAVAQPILEDAKRRASWSRRIPGALGLRTQFSGRKTGVRIVVASRKAPHARPYEGITSQVRDARRAGFRHPVFSEGRFRQQDTWVTQPYRRFLVPAVEAHRERVVSRLLDTVDGVLRRRGY